MAIPYTRELSDYTPSFPTSAFTPLEVKNKDDDGYSISGESFTVPSSADGDGKYRLTLDQIPLEQSSVTITVGAAARTIIPYGETPASGQVALSTATGTIEFHSSDAAGSGSATYTGRGTPLMAHYFHVMEKELYATQVKVLAEAAELDTAQSDISALESDMADRVVGPASATDNALARFDSATGKIIQGGVGILSDAGALSGITSLSTDLTSIGNVSLTHGSGGTIEITGLSAKLILDASGSTGLAFESDAYNWDINGKSSADQLTIESDTFGAALMTLSASGAGIGLVDIADDLDVGGDLDVTGNVSVPSTGAVWLNSDEAATDDLYIHYGGVGGGGTIALGFDVARGGSTTNLFTFSNSAAVFFRDLRQYGDLIVNYGRASSDLIIYDNSAGNMMFVDTSADTIDLDATSIGLTGAVAVTGALSASGNLSVGGSQVISSSQGLENIASVDATTVSSIETGIGQALGTADSVTHGALAISGNVDFSGLPTSDPLVAGRLWNNSGVPNISAG